MEMNLVDDHEKLINPGDVLIVRNNELDCFQLIICCPGCGRVSASRGKHSYNKETKTYTPSIVHDTDYGGCGWHGWLTNGIFTKC